ncbi:MAG: ABC transporter permease [Dethiosulfatibacter sp.]|nr:ABC transporter permease [Dethiosulfatibacter sp.]
MINQLLLRFKLLKDDKILIVVMTLMALGLTLVFSSAMSGNYKPEVMLIDLDNTAASREFVNELKLSRLLRYTETDETNAIKNIETGMSIGGLVIDQGFSNLLIDGEEINISILRSKDSLELIQLQSDVQTTAFKFMSKFKTADITVEIIKGEGHEVLEDVLFEETYDLSNYYWRYRNPFSMNSQVLDAQKDWAYNPMIHYLIGFTLFFSTFTIVFVGSDILKEKQQKTWQRKLVSPVSNKIIISSLLIVTFIVGMIQVGIIVLIGNYFLDINWGMNIGLMLIVFAAFVYTFTAIGLVVAGLARTVEQLGAIVPIILVSSAMLGGTMWPLEIIQSKILLTLANFMPHKWAMQIISQTSAYGLNVHSFITSVFVLIAMGTVYLIIGIKLSKRHVY